MTEDREDWHAVVQRSFLDSRVWIAVLPDSDHMTNMGASTSVRRVKAYAFSKAVVATFARDPEALVWRREDGEQGEEWVLYDA